MSSRRRSMKRGTRRISRKTAGSRMEDTDDSEPVSKRTRSRTQVAAVFLDSTPVEITPTVCEGCIACEPLHPLTCLAEISDIKRMKLVLKVSPGALNRRQNVRPGAPEDGTRLIYPLSMAFRRSHKPCVEFLLKRGAQFERYDFVSPFFELETDESYALSIAKLLLSKMSFSSSDIGDAGICSAMISLAVKKNWNNYLQLILEHGIVTEPSTSAHFYVGIRRDSLYLAASRSNFRAVKLLLLHGVGACIEGEHAEYTIEPMPHVLLYSCFYGGRKPDFDKQKQVIQALKDFQSFGGNLWTKRRSPPHFHLKKDNLLIFLQQTPHFIQKYPEMASEIEHLMRTPQSLLSLSRQAVKRSMGRDYWKNIKTLPIPQTLKPYLQFNVKYLSQC